MNNKLNIAITESLRREIETSGKSKTEIARAIGVSNSTVSQYLSGRAQPTLATLSRLCTFLDCSADEILQIKIK
ncbi:MAG: helix-turn-helix transcriptional regulator [Clostridia bacterium]|nr:helix-turn-helix transcriptional regulator [Clostridia bacterium]